jgi:hypothetical protein
MSDGLLLLLHYITNKPAEGVHAMLNDYYLLVRVS